MKDLLTRGELTERSKALIVDGIPETNLVLYCPGLHGLGGSLLDRSANANHGTISGATWTRLPSGLYVLSFDGSNDYVTGTAKVTVPTAFTCLMWWKRSGNSGGATDSSFHQLIQSLNGAALSYNRLLVIKAGTVLTAQVRVGTSTISNTSTLLAAPWQQVGFMWDAAKVYTIVNGVISAGTAAVGTLASGTNVWVMGWYTSLYYISNGLIGIPYVVSRALSAAEVLTRYSRERHLFGV